MGESGLSFETCAQSKLYSCAIKIFSNQINYFENFKLTFLRIMLNVITPATGHTVAIPTLLSRNQQYNKVASTPVQIIL